MIYKHVKPYRESFQTKLK